ncbi:hypothetical protein [Haloferula sp. BvORR071]|uniref:hypothetical protein n=1 Tax=Haloferula sp. BvORR071 TaxID=1396141 RepID=UPI002240F9A9|nr:hypothetical protein [Haloferula sp. BvORR071]
MPRLRRRRDTEKHPSRKRGGSGRWPLLASLGLHGSLLILALLWVVKGPVRPPQEKTVDFMPSGGGGGDVTAQERSMRKQHRDFTMRQMERLAVKGVSGDIALPEAFASTPLKPLYQLPTASVSRGQGGEGAGGGRGAGQGRGYGNGIGIGSGKGSGASNPFGMMDASSGLSGTFYNLKRRNDGAFLNTSFYDYHRIVHEFVSGDWHANGLEKFFQAPRKLYLTHLYMPAARAHSAPAAFGQTPDDSPAWMVVYRGTVTAPKTGKFRFVGAGDDTLVVRFGGKVVFDYGYFRATNPDAPELRRPVLPVPGRKLAKPFSEQEPETPPPSPPEKKYRYATTIDWNRYLGGMAIGAEFEAVEGKTYPVEIVISEGQGSLFAAALLIEEAGASPVLTRDGAPILPLFRTELTTPPAARSDNAPPYDPAGPVWRIVKGREGI